MLNQQLQDKLKRLKAWAADQYFEEDTKGTLARGKNADFVILDQNPLKIETLDIHGLKIVKAVYRGQQVCPAHTASAD